MNFKNLNLELFDTLFANNTQMRDISKVLVKVHTISNNEFIGDQESDMFNGEFEFSSSFLEDEREHSNGGGVLGLQVAEQSSHGVTGINDIFNNQNFLSLEIKIFVHIKVDFTSTFNIFVALKSDGFIEQVVVVVRFSVSLDEGLVKITKEDSSTLEDDQDKERSFLVIFDDILSDFCESLVDFFVGDEDGGNAVFISLEHLEVFNRLFSVGNNPLGILLRFHYGGWGREDEELNNELYFFGADCHAGLYIQSER